MKFILSIFLTLATVTIWPAYSAYAATAQVNPDDIRDGVVNVVDTSTIADLLEWSQSSKTSLQDGLTRIKELPRSKRRAEYKTLITDVIKSSGDLQTELLMRSVLKRAVNFDDILKSEATSPEQETLAIRILEDSVLWAINLYSSDEEFLKRAAGEHTQKKVSVDLDFASLGIQHAKYVLNNIWIAPSLNTKLVLLKESLSYFFNDLNRDNIARRPMAPVLTKLANFLEANGFTKNGVGITDADFLSNIQNNTALQKLAFSRKIESFYSEQIKKASETKVDRPVSSTYPGSEASNCSGCSTADSILNAEFKWIPAGSFRMGDDSISYAKPVHDVTINQGFYMQKTLVTQLQWYNLTRKNPSNFKNASDCRNHTVMQDGTPLCPTNPVENVSWNDVQAFIDLLNQKVGGAIYRLPSEAEWEYAARGGTQTAYSFGDSDSLLKKYGWYSDNSANDTPDGQRKTHPVAQLQPNPWGLYDMHGNVWEWVDDVWTDDYSHISTNVNPVNCPSDNFVKASPQTTSECHTGSARVIRGGGWFNGAGGLRSALRYGGAASYSDSDVGVRLLRTH